jgi:PAS domain S-box-containing protein
MNLDWKKVLGLTAIPLILVTIAILVFLHSARVFEPPLLLALLNTLFIGIIPIYFSVVAGKTFRINGSFSILALGSGMLVFGLGSIAAGWLNALPGGAEITTAIHNTSAFIGGILTLLAALLVISGTSHERDAGRSVIPSLLYGGGAAFVILFSVAAVQGFVPPFFIQGTGPTVLRQVILSNAAELYAISAVLFFIHYKRTQEDFFFWFSLGLALIMTGLLAILFQPEVGSALGWAGRLAQYGGACFALFAILTAQKNATRTGISLSEQMTRFFVGGEATSAILSATKESIWLFGTDGSILMANPTAAERLGGRSPGELTGRHFSEFMAPDLAQARNARLEEVLRTGKQVRFEDERDGIIFDHSFYPVIDRTGEITAIAAYSRDITEKKQAEKELRKAHARTAAILGQVADTFYSLDDQWRFTMVNPAAEKAPFGRPSSEMIGKVIWDLYPALVGTRIQQHYLDAARQQTLEHYEAQSPLNGRWYEVFMQGRDGGVDVYMRDVTDQRAVETALRDSELRYRTVADFTIDWEFWIDPDGKFIYISPSAEKILARSISAYTAIEPLLRDVVHADDLPDRLAHLKEELAGGGPYEITFRVVRPDGEIRWIHHVCRPVHGPDGAFLGTRGSNRDITERRAAEEALRQSEEKYRTIVETTNEGIWIVDAGRCTTFVNERMAGMLGYTPEEMIGRSYREFVDEESTTISDQAFEERKKGISSSREYRLQKKDGTPLWTFINSQPLFDKTGNFTGSLSMISDITLWKEAEETVRHSEAARKIADAVEAERHRFYDVLETLPVYVCLLDKEYRMPFANRFFREAFGDPKGRRCYDSLFGRTEPCEICETFTVMKTLAPHNWFWTGPNGRDYDVYDFPFTDTDGTVMILEMGIDITERKRAEEEVKKANAYNRSLIEASLDPLVTINPDGTISDVNAATIRVTGYPREELVGTDFSDYFTEPEKAKAGYEKAFRDGLVTDYELEIHRRDGHVTPVIYNATVYRDASGNITGVFASARDITERKKAEEAIRKAHDLLEDRVKRRTTELAVMNAHLKEEIAHRRVAESLVKKTVAELHAAIESTADGIYAVDRTRKILRYNQKFASMWKIPDAVLESGDDCSVTEYLRSQVKNPGLFADNEGEYTYVKDRETYDMLELVDGRIFERYSKPQKLDAAIIGRVMSYRDVTDRRQAEEKLLQSLQEKETLIREIHHRVKNNLQIISGLLDMTRMRTPDSSTSGILTDMMMKIKTMAQIHTRLYESKQFDKINMGSQIRDQVTDLSSIYGRSGTEIECGIDAQEIYLPVDQAIPCALVVNEILSNAFKHAFPGRKHGLLNISVMQTDDHVRIHVQDDGVGIPGDVDVYKTTSLGLKLIRSLVQQLGGTVTITSTRGTEVTVEFPLHTGG